MVRGIEIAQLSNLASFGLWRSVPLTVAILPVSTFSDWLFSCGQTSAIDCSLEEVWTHCGVRERGTWGLWINIMALGSYSFEVFAG